LGVAMLMAAIGYLGTRPAPAAALALLIALALGGWLVAQRFMQWRSARTGG
jgi:hypothetical protein